MKPWPTTLSLLAAAGLCAAAVYATRPITREVALFSDQGGQLVEGLTDPLAVKSLEVFSFSKQSSRVQAFKVSFDGAHWVIPSHSGYPADAAAKVGAAAAAFANLVKERVASDDKRDHARFGVLAPDDQTLSPDGVGTRVRLTDAAGKVLADLIVGNPVSPEGAAPAPDSGSTASTKRYIRHADSNRVYATTFSAGFSTRFADWVQVDLLQLTQDLPVGVFIDRYKIDEQTATLTNPSHLTLTRAAQADDTGQRPWFMSSKAKDTAAPGEAADSARINEMLAALSGLKIVGVRAKPANLAKVLSTPDKAFKLGLTDQLSLQSRGFFLASDGRFVANEGQMSVQTSEGIVYSLWFGEGVPDTEDAASGGRVGTSDPAAPPPDPAAAKKVTGTARYLMVSASFDAALLPEPVKPQALIDLEKQAEAAAQAAPAPTEPAPAAAPPEPATATSQGTPPASTTPLTPPAVDAKALEEARNAHQAKVDVWKNQLDSGKKKADQLAKRFADWYYVIDAPSLDKLRPSRADLAKPTPPPPPVPAAPPQSP